MRYLSGGLAGWTGAADSVAELFLYDTFLDVNATNI